MKLYLNATSPFARWVLVCALEYAIDPLELVWVNPWEVPEDLRSLNPFSTVPVLQTDTGEALYESSLIVRYLIPTVDHLATYQSLALGEMLLETAFRHVVLQRDQPSDTLPHPLIAQTQQTLARVLQTLTPEDLPIVTPPDRPDLASLQLAVGLDYLGWRRPNLLAADLPPALHDRLATYQSRSSFQLTDPMVLAAHPSIVSPTFPGLNLTARPVLQAGA
jgi:glutathione S-transferase